jgi:hypothetical protein
MTMATGPDTRHRRGGAAAAVLAVALCVLQAGCGYSLAGRGAFLPDYIETIGVPLFINNTAVFDIEQALTQRVRQEFIGRGKYRVVPDATGVDALLLGTVNSISVSPAGFNDQQQATRYAVVVVMKVEFRDLRADKILWENPSLTFRDEYDLVSSGTTVDANIFFGQESNAIDRLATNFARSVVTSILEAF